MNDTFPPRPGPPPPGPQAPGPQAPGPHAGRGWWRAIGSVVAVLVLGFTTLQVVSMIGSSSETLRRVVSAEGLTSLDIRSDSGDVVVTGSDRDDVLIVARVRHGLWRSRVTIEERDGVVTTSTSCPFLSNNCAVDYSIEVPTDLAVRVHSGNGTVSARDLRGRAELTSGNGDVRANGLAGSVQLRSANGQVEGFDLGAGPLEASSDNGDVTVELTQPPTHVVAESDNGDVEVTLPDTGDAYDLEMATDNGSRSGQIRTDPSSARRLVIRSDNGDVRVAYRFS